jgi:hypothetical protein
MVMLRIRDALVARTMDFAAPLVHCPAPPEVLARLRVIWEAIAPLLARGPGGAGPGGPDGFLICRVLHRAVANLLVARPMVCISQTVAHAMDQDLEIQERGAALVPVYPSPEAFHGMVRDMSEAILAFLGTLGVPVIFAEPVPEDIVSSLAELPRKDRNRRLLTAEFPLLNLEGYRVLTGETPFWLDQHVMPGPQSAATRSSTDQQHRRCLGHP